MKRIRAAYDTLPMMSISTTTGVLPLADVDLYYEVTGSGPAIVFAHGLGGNHLSWWQQIPFFSERYTCVAFAHRGFSPSVTGPEPDAWDPAHYVNDLAALIDHLKLSTVSLVAQSMGGWACLEYTLRYPDRVDKLVLADTAGTLNLRTLDPPEPEAMAQWYAINAKVNEDLFRRGIHPAAGERMAREQPEMHFLYREIDRLSSRVDKLAMRARLVGMWTTPVSRLKEIRTPVLFMVGDEDVVFPPAAAASLAALAPAGEVERVPQTGHSVYFERAALFNQRVSAFLQR